jgi:hypothetical protein
MARLSVPVGGRVRKLRAVGEQTGHPIGQRGLNRSGSQVGVTRYSCEWRGGVNNAMKLFYQHANLVAGRWQTLPLAEQLANVGSDVTRAYRWQEKDPQLYEKVFARALELLDLTDDRRSSMERSQKGTHACAGIPV